MPVETTPPNAPTAGRSAARIPCLERLTGAVLLIVLSALAWMVAAAIRPEFARLPSVEHEVVLMLILLGAALLLVSLVALIHTRR